MNKFILTVLLILSLGLVFLGDQLARAFSLIERDADSIQILTHIIDQIQQKVRPK